MEPIAEHPDEAAFAAEEASPPRLSPLVDMSNAWLRYLLESGTYLKYHQTALDSLRGQLAGIAEIAAARENEAAEAEAREARPLAFVFDIDEVLLSNVACQGACRAGKGVFFPADYFADGEGRPWPRSTPLSPALPGAHELLAEAARLGEVALVTGRGERLRDETVDNFVAVGLAGLGAPLDEDALRAGGALVMCPDARLPAPGQSIEPFKRAARVRISQTHRIAAIVGDQPSDMGVEGDFSLLVPNPFYYTA